MLQGVRDAPVASCSYSAGAAGSTARRQPPPTQRHTAHVLAQPRKACATVSSCEACLLGNRGRRRRAAGDGLVTVARAAAGDDVIDVQALDDEVGLAPRPNEELAPNREGYQSVPLDGCEFLVATTAAGALDLRDCYVYDADSGVYARPDAPPEHELPQAPALFQMVPWKEEFLGDRMNYKDPQVWIKKVFLIRVESERPYNLCLDEVWQLDADSRALLRCAVEREGPKAEREVLRVRDGKFTIVEEAAAPTPDEVIDAAEQGLDAPSGKGRDEGEGETVVVVGEEDTGDEEEMMAGDEDDIDNLDAPTIDLA